MPTTRTGSPAVMGVARLVRARHGAPRTSTVPSGATSTRAAPTSPTIDSRPIVGVANRARTIDGMPATMNRATPATTRTRTNHDDDTPSYSPTVPTANDTVPMTVHARGAPACTSTA